MEKDKGLYHKFDIRRKDGQSGPGQKHDKCEYFVLDLTHDPFARTAMEAYQKACESEYPLLARDIKMQLVRLSI